MGEDEGYAIPKGILSRLNERVTPGDNCISCGAPLDDDYGATEIPTCRICGAPQISDAAGDWLETEIP